jgi:hypothetical protein
MDIVSTLQASFTPGLGVLKHDVSLSCSGPTDRQAELPRIYRTAVFPAIHSPIPCRVNIRRTLVSIDCFAQLPLIYKVPFYLWIPYTQSASFILVLSIRLKMSASPSSARVPLWLDCVCAIYLLPPLRIHAFANVLIMLGSRTRCMDPATLLGTPLVT